jgi:hypothetical protein
VCKVLFQLDTRRGDQGATAGHRLARLGAPPTEARNQCGAPSISDGPCTHVPHCRSQHRRAGPRFVLHTRLQVEAAPTVATETCVTHVAARSRSSACAPHHSPRCLCRQAAHGSARHRRPVCQIPHPPRACLAPACIWSVTDRLCDDLPDFRIIVPDAVASKTNLGGESDRQRSSLRAITELPWGKATTWGGMLEAHREVWIWIREESGTGDSSQWSADRSRWTVSDGGQALQRCRFFACGNSAFRAGQAGPHRTSVRGSYGRDPLTRPCA